MLIFFIANYVVSIIKSSGLVSLSRNACELTRASYWAGENDFSNSEGVTEVYRI